MKKFFLVVRQAFIDSLAYSTSTFVWFAIALLEVVIPMIIWLTATPTNGTFSDFTKYQIFIYYSLTAIVGNVTFWWIEEGIAARVRSGDLSNLMLKPLSFLNYCIWFQIGEKLFGTLIRLPLFLFVLYFFWRTLNLAPSAFIAVGIGSITYLLICLLFSTLSFYMTDLSGFTGLFYFTSYMLSGELAPLAFYPAWFAKIANFLPYRYTFSFPIEIFMNRLSQVQIAQGFVIQLFWLVILSLTLKVLWRRALKTYQAYGK